MAAVKKTKKTPRLARSPKEAARVLEVEERRQLVLKYKRRGKTLREIKELLALEHDVEVSHQTVKNDLDAVLAELQASQLAEMGAIRELELSRLDWMFDSLSTGIATGDPQAVNAGLRVCERRHKLLGLDAPTKQEVSGNQKVIVEYVNADSADTSEIA